jgi:hypothetical protein
VLRLGRPWYRIACVGVALVTIPLGLAYGLLQLGALTIGLVILLAREGWLQLRRDAPAGSDVPAADQR